MAQMSPVHRTVLLAEIGESAGASGTAASIKMMRSRARKRLTTILESGSAGLVVIVPWARRAAGHAGTTLRRMIVPQASAGAAFVAVFGAVTLLILPTPAVLSPAQRSPSIATATTAVAASDKPLLRATLPSRDPVGSIPRQGESSKRNERPQVGAGETSEDQTYEFHFGDEDDPVESEAVITVGPQEGEQGEEELPGCSVDRPGPSSVRATCRATVQDREIELEVEAEASP